VPVPAPAQNQPPADPQAQQAPAAPQQQAGGAAVAQRPRPPRGTQGGGDDMITFRDAGPLPWDWAAKTPAPVVGAPVPIGDDETLVKFYSRVGPAFAKAAGQNLKVLVPKSTVGATVRDDVVKAIAGAVDASTAA